MGTVGKLGRIVSVAAVLGLVATLTLAGVAEATFGGAPSGDGVQPVQVQGNPGCSGGTTELKVEPVADGTYSNGTLTVTVDVRSTAAGPVFDWTSNIGVDAVIVKGGPNANVYAYPSEDTGDTGLHAPINQANDTYYGLSHISFCYDVPPTGRLTVVKQVVNDDGGSAAASNWTMNVAGPTPLSFPGAGSPGTTNTVEAGDYKVTESGGPSGYTLTYSGDCDSSGNVTVPAFHEKTCILTNDDQPATLIVRKVVVNDHGGTKSAGDFSFSVNGGAAQSFEGDGENQLTVDAGTYTVTEPEAAGYATSYDGCSSIQLAPGATATCTITNDDRPATLIVRKVVVNDDGGTKSAGDFSFSVNGGAVQAFEADGENQLLLAPGTFSVTEPAAAGYTTSYDNCSNLVIPAGGSATCTITNDDQPATLIVRKVVVNDNGGGASASDFGFSLNGGAAQAFEADGENQLTADAGTYTVTEPAADGYATSYDNCSNVFVPNGGSATCTITNDDLPATLIVRKVVVNDSGGAATVDDFSFSVNGGAAQAFEQDGENQMSVAPGTYTVTEPAADGYTTSYDNCSNLAVKAGATAVCTITNDDQEAHLIVRKIVVNHHGGTKSAGDFSFSVNGGDVQAFEADGENDLTVVPGSYSVTEPAVAGYATSYEGCSDIELELGETATCTITNSDQPGTLIVHKVVVNDDGGTAVASDFSFSVNGGESQPFELDGRNDLVVDAGTYSVTESAHPGYTTSYDNCDHLVIPLGGSATCTITNDDDPATLIVHKVVVNEHGGTKQASDFSFVVNGGDAQAFEADGENVLSVPAGIYDVSEPSVAGYKTSYDNCQNVELDLGESATCTITNRDVPRGQGSLSVSKSADPTSLKEPGGQVTYSVRITNTSLDVDLAVLNVVDDKFGDLDDDGGSGCFDVPINLAPGQFASCQFTKQITGVGGTSHVNTVTASGVDENGHSVSASDDAKVDILERAIDLVIQKDATSPTPLNGVVHYTLTVENRGPDTTTNVQVADPAPAGIAYLSASASQGTCSVSAALVSCSLGTLAPGQQVTIKVDARATQVGHHVNQATVTGSGGREQNPADNVDTAETVVPAPLTPPTPKPKPKPKPELCINLTITPKMITADGRPDRLSVTVTQGTKRVAGQKVLVKGTGVYKQGRSNGRGVARLHINPKKAGIITITALETKGSKVCGAKRVGVVGVFLPPLTG